MPDIFKSSESEKNRIRNLHETEGKNKKIDSSLIKEAAAGLCGGPYPGSGGPVGGEVSWGGNCPGSPNLLNPFPCARVDGQTPHSGMIGWQISFDGGAMGYCAKITGVGPFNGQSTSTTPTPLTRGDDCDNCNQHTGGGDTTFDCDNGTCVAVQGTGGQYTTLAACQAACEQEDKWECNGETGTCYQDPNGQYSSQAACIQNCQPDRTWNCTQAGLCIAVPNTMGQFQTEQDCLQNCEQPTYNCKWVSGDPQGKARPVIDRGGVEGKTPMTLKEQVNVSGYQCVIHQGAGTGQYPNLPACQAVCGEEQKRNYCVNCEKQVMSYYPNPNLPGATSCPQGFVDIGTNPSPPQGPCLECVNGNCVTTGNGWSGPYNDMTQCIQVCQPLLWKCQTQGQPCVQDPTGTYNDEATCNAACIGNNWKCTAGPQGCVQDPGGPFTTEQSCIDDCCAGHITNWNWVPMPNPNCNQVCAKLNTGAMVAIANGTSTNFIHQCRHDWLVAQGCNCTGVNGCCGGSNVLSGSLPVPQQTVAYGACIAQTFVTMVENAMTGNNPSGNPYGCLWLQHVKDQILTGGNNNLATATAASTICSLTGRLIWIDNLMNSGTAYGYNPSGPTPNLSTPCPI